MRHFTFTSAAVLSLVSPALLGTLAGCSLQPSATAVAPSGPVVQTTGIRGTALGGQQPMAGSHVYLLAAGASGYGSASTSLLEAAATGQGDGLGAYVTTGENGSFAIPGNAACAPGSQVYLLVTGGNPGYGINSAAALMAAIGACPAEGSLAGNVPSLVVNEISTVAAAYALAGYAADATHIGSSGTPQALTAMGSAFANAGQLYSLSGSATALAVTPHGNGIVPQAELNTLGNILAACIHSAGPGSKPCVTLFANSAEGAAQPRETATAAINIAHHPAANVAALFALQEAAAPFQPSLNAPPNDFSVTLTFRDAAFSAPSGVAVDAEGNVTVADAGSSSLSRLSPLGIVSTVASPYLGGVYGLAHDTGGNLWTTAPAAPYITQYSFPGNSYFFISGYPAPDRSLPGVDSNGYYYTGAFNSTANYIYYSRGDGYTALSGTAIPRQPYATAVDSHNYSWTVGKDPSLTSGATLMKLKYTTTYDFTTCTGTDYAQGSGVAVDHGNNVWVSDAYTGKLVKFAGTCAYSGSYSARMNAAAGAGLTGGTSAGQGLVGVAVDGGNNIWTMTAGGRLLALTNSGAPLMGSGLETGASGTLLGPAIDPSGNVWFSNTTSNTVSEVIGAAAPVVTPLALAVKNDALGSRP